MDHIHEHFQNHHGLGIGRIVAMTIGGVMVAGLFALAFGWLVMLLWNWLMPGIFSLKPVTYWQAFGMILLAKLFFGGIRGHDHFRHHPPFHLRHNPHFARRHAWNDDEWAPGGDHRNWMYYRRYWKERGKSDFENYLKEIGRDADNTHNDNGEK